MNICNYASELHAIELQTMYTFTTESDGCMRLEFAFAMQLRYFSPKRTQALTIAHVLTGSSSNRHKIHLTSSIEFVCFASKSAKIKVDMLSIIYHPGRNVNMPAKVLSIAIGYKWHIAIDFHLPVSNTKLCCGFCSC